MTLSDHPLSPSGVGTQTKYVCQALLDTGRYSILSLGGAIKHPENGKRVDMNQVLREETGVEDAKLTIYPSDGYGNPDPVYDVV